MGCRAGQKRPLWAAWCSGSWRIEVWSLVVAADSLLLLLSLADSIVTGWKRGPGLCLLMMSWQWDCPHSFVAGAPAASLSALFFYEQGSAGRGNGQGRSPMADNLPESYQPEPEETVTQTLLLSTAQYS